ncbi:hypothetical protein [Variovorax sp. Sphag1AA]|uniref:hypothetical protein n=1 Tax=Variovorax sp. Sphag1AA TaxID=2587027 RepID=UPI0016171575|nr:hypothetical protein [Variovorax sp. Sphag1AA]MBB3175906.1 hypothetical protein [Variovorax sp. Sphag1AA]
MSFRFVIRAAACLLALNVVFVMLMVAIQTLDSGRVQERLRKDVGTGRLIASNWDPGPYGQGMDLFTECIALGAGTIPPEGKSALTRALEHRYIVGINTEKADPCGALVSNLRDGASVQVAPYMRYWHGYDVYLRPMLWAGIPLARVHYVSLILLTILSVGLLHASTRVLPMPIVASLLGTLFLTTDLFTFPFVTVHAVGLMVCLATAWAAAVHLKSRPHDGSGLLWIALLSGALFAFVDFLVNPPLTPALMMFLIIAATRWNRPDVSARSLLLSSTGVTLTWFFSYAATWIGKWVISAIFLGPQQVISEVFSNIVRRTVEDPQGEIGKQLSVHIGTPTLANIQSLGWPLFVLSLAIAAALLAFTLVRGRFTKGRVADFLIVVSPALIPVVWMELMRNHSIVHSWFVYRDLGLSLGIVVAASMFVLLAARRAPRSVPATRTDSGLAPAQ